MSYFGLYNFLWTPNLTSVYTLTNKWNDRKHELSFWCFVDIYVAVERDDPNTLSEIVNEEIEHSTPWKAVNITANIYEPVCN